MTRNPLSVFTYYRRNKKRAIPILLVFFVAVLGITMMVTLLDGLATTKEIFYGRLKRCTIVSPMASSALEPAVIERIKTNKHVQDVYLNRGLNFQVPVILGNTIAELYAVPENDVGELLDLYEAKIVEGRLPRMGSNEFALSEDVTRARELKIGSKIGRDVNSLDVGIEGEFVLVGILQGSATIGFASYEFLESDALYSDRPVSIVVVPKDGEKEEMDQFLKSAISSRETYVHTYEDSLQESRQTMFTMHIIIGLVDVLLITVLSIAVGMLNYIYFMQRVGEFGILHALGIGKGSLVRKTTLEIVSLMGLAWLTGEIIAVGLLTWISAAVFAPRGQTLNPLDVRALLFTIPIPAVVALLGVGTVLRTLSRLDPVSIIERRF